MNLFDHVNAIYLNQDVHYFDALSEEDQKVWNTYIVNRTISMNMAYLPIVNEVQQYMYSLNPNSVYLFYSQILPKGKQYNKYIKKTEKDIYPDWLLDVVKGQYQLSYKEAREYLDIFHHSKSGKESLTELLNDCGIESTQRESIGL